eukprot:529887-Amphidinium_carterae.1
MAVITAALFLLWAALQSTVQPWAFASSNVAASPDYRACENPYANSPNTCVHDANPKEMSVWERLRSWFGVENVNATFVHDIHNYEFEYAYYYVGYYAEDGGDYHYEYAGYYYHVEPDVIVAAGYVDQTYDYGVDYAEYYTTNHLAVAKPDNQITSIKFPSLADALRVTSVVSSLLSGMWQSDNTNEASSTSSCWAARGYGYYYSLHYQQTQNREASQHLWPVAATIGATFSPVVYKQRRHLVGLVGLARQLQAACCSDFAQILLVILMCCCNVTLILVKRVPTCLGKRIMRKMALRARNTCKRYLGEPMFDSDNDVILVEPPQ